MGTHRGRKLDLQHPRAALTFDDVMKAFYIHGQQIYPIASAPASIFKAAVLALVPHWKDSSTYGEALASKEIDVVTRWWLLCALADAGQAMTLYGSREQAEQAMSDQGQCAQV